MRTVTTDTGDTPLRGGCHINAARDGETGRIGNVSR
jgi:hypothetical protein